MKKKPVKKVVAKKPAAMRNKAVANSPKKSAKC